MRRPDDNEQTVRTRLAEYRAKTAPILPYYEERGLVRRVDGMGTPDEVAAEIDAILDSDRLGRLVERSINWGISECARFR